MLSLKTNLSAGGQGGSSYRHSLHHASTTGGLPALATPSSPTSADQALTVVNVNTSCCSLVEDNMSTAADSTSTASSSATNGSSNSSGFKGLMKKKPSMKSSYALTSMLSQAQQQQPQDDEVDDILNKHSNSSPTLSLGGSLSDGIATTTLTAAIAADAAAMVQMSPSDFGTALQSIQNDDDNNSPFEEQKLRQALEYPLRQARKMRDAHRRPPLTSWIGLPYAPLREERPFLYDHMHTHPLADILKQTLGVQTDLSQLHQGWTADISAKEHQRQVFSPLLNKSQRTQFQQAYESFVTSCCIPLLHAAALRHDVFPTGPAGVVYRYQVFPTINVVYPNDPDACRPPTCDLSQHKSVGWLHFHVPLTASVGTSAVYCERYPGREDWHALRCTSVGLGYCWDGARCLSFVPLNTTGQTRVSLDFRILLVRPEDHISDATTTLCRPEHLQDSLTCIPGFYEEATMDGGGASRILMRRRSSSSSSTSTPTRRQQPVEPDARCGFPFA